MIYSDYIQKFSLKSDLDEKQLTEAFKYMFLIGDNLTKNEIKNINTLSKLVNIKKLSYKFVEKFFEKNIKLTTICWNVRHLFYLIYKYSKTDEEYEIFMKICLFLVFDSKKSCDNLKVLSNKEKNIDIFGEAWWKTVNTDKDEPTSWYIGKSKNGTKLFQKNRSYDSKSEEIALNIISLETNIKSYEKIKMIYNHFSETKIRERCKVIIWMRYRIDLRTYNYEKDIKE